MPHGLPGRQAQCENAKTIALSTGIRDNSKPESAPGACPSSGKQLARFQGRQNQLIGLYLLLRCRRDFVAPKADQTAQDKGDVR